MRDDDRGKLIDLVPEPEAAVACVTPDVNEPESPSISEDEFDVGRDSPCAVQRDTVLLPTRDVHDALAFEAADECY